MGVNDVTNNIETCEIIVIEGVNMPPMILRLV